MIGPIVINPAQELQALQAQRYQLKGQLADLQEQLAQVEGAIAYVQAKAQEQEQGDFPIPLERQKSEDIR